jgi:hypothetical protein
VVARWFVFVPKIPIWVYYGGPLELKMLVYFMTFRNILRPLGLFHFRLVQFVVIWYIFPVLVCLDQEKSGNPEQGNQMCL